MVILIQKLNERVSAKARINQSVEIKISLQKGCVYYIRFIRSDLKLYLPNESFTLMPELKYSYVVAEINIDNHSLIIRQNGEIKQVFAYTLNAIGW